MALKRAVRQDSQRIPWARRGLVVCRYYSSLIPYVELEDVWLMLVLEAEAEVELVFAALLW